MNILMIYRTKVILSEILKEINLHKNDSIILAVTDRIKLVQYSVDSKNINNVKVISVQDLLKGELDNMKFDYIVGNPPYQETTGDTTKPIWDKLVIKSYNLLKNKGTMSLIHPGAWRFATEKSKGAVREVQRIYKNNKITKMELNNTVKGLKTFNAATDYDIITLVKEAPDDIVEVKTETDKKIKINIKNYNIIPTDCIELFSKLKANLHEDRVELINDYSYGSDGRFKHVSEVKSKYFKYPVIYGMPDRGIKYMYSNTTSKGHFGIPKLIIAKAGPLTILDLKGEYGMTQFSAAIVDTPENLVKIQKVIETDNFRALKGVFCGIGPSSSKNAIIDNRGTMFKVIKEFKKDFWKEFYTEEMEKELIEEGRLKI